MVADYFKYSRYLPANTAARPRGVRGGSIRRLCRYQSYYTAVGLPGFSGFTMRQHEITMVKK